MPNIISQEDTMMMMMGELPPNTKRIDQTTTSQTFNFTGPLERVFQRPLHGRCVLALLETDKVTLVLESYEQSAKPFTQRADRFAQAAADKMRTAPAGSWGAVIIVPTIVAVELVDQRHWWTRTPMGGLLKDRLRQIGCKDYFADYFFDPTAELYSEKVLTGTMLIKKIAGKWPQMFVEGYEVQYEGDYSAYEVVTKRGQWAADVKLPAWMGAPPPPPPRGPPSASADRGGVPPDPAEQQGQGGGSQSGPGRGPPYGHYSGPMDTSPGRRGRPPASHSYRRRY